MKYDALFEDEDDVLSGSPKSVYWGMASKISQDFLEDAFDDVVQKIAVMESLLSEHYDEDRLDSLIDYHYKTNTQRVDELKKSVYMELGGKLIYKIAD